MALDSLLARFEGRAVTPVTADVIADVTPRPAPVLACTPVTSVTAQNDITEDSEKSQQTAAAEARRQRVLAMLAKHPETRYAVVVDNPDADPVLLTLAIRGQATCELAIPAAKFDAFLLLDLLARHGAQTVH